MDPQEPLDPLNPQEPPDPLDPQEPQDMQEPQDNLYKPAPYSFYSATLFLYKQPEKDLSLKSCLNFSRFLRSKLLKIPSILVNLTRKQ